MKQRKMVGSFLAFAIILGLTANAFSKARTPEERGHTVKYITSWDL